MIKDPQLSVVEMGSSTQFVQVAVANDSKGFTEPQEVQQILTNRGWNGLAVTCCARQLDTVCKSLTVRPEYRGTSLVKSRAPLLGPP